jgi:hypothetical protein
MKLHNIAVRRDEISKNEIGRLFVLKAMLSSIVAVHGSNVDRIRFTTEYSKERKKRAIIQSEICTRQSLGAMLQRMLSDFDRDDLESIIFNLMAWG